MSLGNNFSYLTLLPNDHGERRLHWQYKLKKIRKTMYFYGLALFVTFLVTITMFIFGRTVDEFIFVLISVLALALFTMIYYLSKKSDLFIYLLPIFRLILHGVWLYATRKFVMSENKCQFSDVFILLMDETYFGLSFLFDCVFLCPGLMLTLLTYAPLFIGSHAILAFVRLPRLDMLSLVMKISLTSLWFCLVFLIYYLLSLQDVIQF